MTPIYQWPAPILRRWLGLPAMGLGCLLIGSAGSVVLKDRFMFFLSAAACAACLAKAFSFYRLVSRREYDIVEGVCIEIRQHPLQRSCKAKFVDADDHTHVFSLEKGTRVFVGCQYRFYLRRQDEAAKSASHLLPFSPPAELLGYEKIEDASLPADPEENI